jgi:hypothetical protein
MNRVTLPNDDRSWKVHTAESAIKDLMEAVKSSYAGYNQPSSVMVKVVDWLPKKLDDGTWMHWVPLRPELVATSKRAYAECSKLPDGVDWYTVLGRMVDK